MSSQLPYHNTVKPPIRNTPKEDKPSTSQQRTHPMYCIHTLYKITSRRGQPLYKGQNAWVPIMIVSTIQRLKLPKKSKKTTKNTTPNTVIGEGKAWLHTRTPHYYRPCLCKKKKHILKLINNYCMNEYALMS